MQRVRGGISGPVRGAWVKGDPPNLRKGKGDVFLMGIACWSLVWSCVGVGVGLVLGFLCLMSVIWMMVLPNWWGGHSRKLLRPMREWSRSQEEEEDSEGWVRGS